MKALLINPKAHHAYFTPHECLKLMGRKSLDPPLGLITVAALLPREWDLRVVDETTRDITEDDWAWADIVMITGMVINKTEILALIRECKQRGKRVVVGGPYATVTPHELLEAGPDLLVRGEAENTISMLLEALAEGRTGVIENSVRPDVSTSPIPRYDLLNLEDYQELCLQTGRGCPNMCDFCDVVNMTGRKPRYKGVDQILAELESLYALGGRGHIFVVDDNFIGNKARAREILNALIPWNKERGEPFGFGCQASMDLGQDNELIDLMTAANFGNVFVGIESPDEDVLERSRKHQNVRNPMVQSLNNIKENGLCVMGSFIIGFDGEKKGVDERIIALVEKTDIPQMIINTLQAGPQTRLGIRLKEEGRLLSGTFTGEAVFTRMNFVPTRPAEEILEEHRDLHLYLYEPVRYLERAYRYCLAIRPTRRAAAIAKGETPPATVSKPVPWRAKWRDLRALALFIWKLGIQPPYRFTFWRLLMGMRKKNPSRLRFFLIYCAFGLDIFKLREVFLTQIVSPDYYVKSSSATTIYERLYSSDDPRSGAGPEARVG